MGQDPSFDELLDGLRQRDNAAATRVFNQFGRRLIALARSRLDSRLLPKVDPEDVVQSVFRTVFRRLGEGQFDLGGWDSLWSLLTCITIRKCGQWSKYYHARARDVRHEVAALAPADSSDSDWQLIDREPAPAEAATLAETVERLLHGLDEREQQMAMLSLQGYTVAEVSGQVGCTASKVYRLLRLLRNRLERMRGEEREEVY